jgi:hypothetical protein
MEDVVQVMAAALAPIVAIFGIIIAWRQFDINRKRLKMDLFDRRYAVYDAAREFMQEIFQAGVTKPGEKFFQFNFAVGESRFLFDKDVIEFLEKMLKNAFEMQMYMRRLERLPVGDERNIVVEKESLLLDWFTGEAAKQLTDKFLPYLKLEH